MKKRDEQLEEQRKMGPNREQKRKGKTMSSVVGYKVYFDGKQFKNEDTMSAVQSLPVDSTDIWMDTVGHAREAVDKYNKRLGDVKVCKDCGRYFIQSQDEVDWFIERDMKPPVRCITCRKKRKNEKKQDSRKEKKA